MDDVVQQIRGKQPEDLRRDLVVVLHADATRYDEAGDGDEDEHDAEDLRYPLNSSHHTTSVEWGSILLCEHPCHALDDARADPSAAPLLRIDLRSPLEVRQERLLERCRELAIEQPQHVLFVQLLRT